MASGSPVYGFSLFGCAGSPAAAIPNVLRSIARASEAYSHKCPFIIKPLPFLSRQRSGRPALVVLVYGRHLSDDALLLQARACRLEPPVLHLHPGPRPPPTARHTPREST